MSETIRDYLKRRTRRFMAIGFGSWLFFALSAGFGHIGPKLGPAVFVGFGILFGAVLALLFFVKCPKCGTGFWQLAGQLALHWGSRRRVNFCPYCGVSLDEPMPTKLIS